MKCKINFWKANDIKRYWGNRHSHYHNHRNIKIMIHYFLLNLFSFFCQKWIIISTHHEIESMIIIFLPWLLRFFYFKEILIVVVVAAGRIRDCRNFILLIVLFAKILDMFLYARLLFKVIWVFSIFLHLLLF